MTSPTWELQANKARLRIGDLEARIDLSPPSGGLAGVRLGDESLGDTSLLAIDAPPFAASNPAPLERHVRGAKLVAAYEESDDWPVRVDLSWRAEPLPSPHGSCVSVQLVVSVRTSVLETRPELCVSSSLPNADVLRMADGLTGRFKELTDADSSTIKPLPGTTCVLVRPADSGWSYAEMVHPADSLLDRFGHRRRGDQTVELRHTLFPHPLEKGVILRARIVGAFVPRSADARRAADCYAAFAAEEPPLGN
ncbi:MAG: hypothetical protein ACYTG0_04340 [Planctomycetota bacterium]|jgi:hypothetical protein